MADDQPSNRPPLIGPGGKVNPQAIRASYDDAVLDADDDAIAQQGGKVQFTLQRDLGSRLDRYLTTRIPFMSRSKLADLIAGGGAMVNGKPAKASTKLRLGDIVDVVIPPPPTSEIEPEDIPIDVLFEDDHLIVLNKQADIIVHPARAENSGTMVHALAWHFKHVTGGGLSRVGNEFARPGVVHRLDRHTTGCIVFAKNEMAHWKIAAQFQDRTADKRYLALVQGAVEPDAQVINQPIGPHPSRTKGYRERQVVRHDDLGKPSVTICRVRERYRDHDRPVGLQAFTLVELELKTGRTHQIRVHLAHAGWPIVGDDMYGGQSLFDSNEAPIITRQALHAGLLAFEHPISHQPLSFAAPPPDDFRAAIKHLRQMDTQSVHVEGTVPLERLGLDTA